MLRNATDLQGYAIHATDGQLGHISEFYFDDQSWTIRYLVVDTGNWLSGRLVLIANAAIGEVKWDEREVSVNLTRKQVENAPGVELHLPVTRRHEAALSDYYGHPYYWGGAGVYGMGVYPGFLVNAGNSPTSGGEASPENSHLQSTHDVRGYHIEATDGEIGHVEDFVLDDEDWTIHYLEVDTRNWWPGKKVLLSPSWITEIDWADRGVRVKLPREVIQNAPESDPDAIIAREYEINLFDYYGRYFEDGSNVRYWESKP